MPNTPIFHHEVKRQSDSLMNVATKHSDSAWAIALSNN